MKFKPTISGGMAATALFCSLGGAAFATGKLHILIGTSNIRNGSITPAKLSKSLQAELTTITSIKTQSGVSVVTITGPRGATGAQGPQGERGPAGPAGAPMPQDYNATTFCETRFCMESNYGTGESGWFVAGNRTNSIPVGDIADLNITVAQPGRDGAMGENGLGELSLTYDARYFQFVNDQQGDCSTVQDSLLPDYSGQVECQQEGYGGPAKNTDLIRFKAIAATPYTTVTADALLWGTGGADAQPSGVNYFTHSSTSGIFPVAVG